jgi:hypothetical protein
MHRWLGPKSSAENLQARLRPFLESIFFEKKSRNSRKNNSNFDTLILDNFDTFGILILDNFDTFGILTTKIYTKLSIEINDEIVNTIKSGRNSEYLGTKLYF